MVDRKTSSKIKTDIGGGIFNISHTKQRKQQQTQSQFTLKALKKLHVCRKEKTKKTHTKEVTIYRNLEKFEK